MSLKKITTLLSPRYRMNQMLVNSLPTPAFWVNEELTIMDVNESFLLFLEKPREEVIGTNLRSYSFLNLLQYFDNLDILRGRDVTIIDHLMITRFKKSIRFIIKEFSNSKSFLIIGVDLSHDYYREETREETRHQQEESTRFMLLGQMASGVAHEVNNPLAIIQGTLAHIKRDIEKSHLSLDKDALLNKISRGERSIDRIAMIIRGLKYLSKSDHQVPLERIELKQIILNALDLVTDKLKVNDIKLTTNNLEKKLYINCYPVKITQVLINLIINSIEAIANLKERWITLTCEEDAGSIFIVVTDSGKGIPKDLHQKIMTPFFTTKPVGQGVGLGLSTSKMIIHDHGAELIYDDEAPNTTFKIKFKK